MIFRLFSVRSNEIVTRFLFEKGIAYNAGGSPEPKWQSLMPENKNFWRRFETSVFRIHRWVEDRTWTEGHRIAVKRNKRLVGRADIEVAQIKTLCGRKNWSGNLGVRPAPLPLWHAVILGWPSLRDERMKIAQALAGESHTKVI
jgi:hypothetical protein